MLFLRPGTNQVSEAGWTVNPKNPQASTSTVLVLQACTTKLGFLFYFYINSGGLTQVLSLCGEHSADWAVVLALCLQDSLLLLPLIIKFILLIQF